MVIGHDIIQIHPVYGSTMQISPVGIVGSFGYKTENIDGRMVENYPVPKLRKLLRLILKHGDDEDIELCDRTFEHGRVHAVWTEEKERAGR